jgi:hypothetical protein
MGECPCSSFSNSEDFFVTELKRGKLKKNWCKAKVNACDTLPETVF